MSRKERRAERATARGKLQKLPSEAARREGYDLRVRMLTHHAGTLLQGARQAARSASPPRRPGEFMGVVVDLREAEGVGWALGLGMTADQVRQTIADTSQKPTAAGIAERDAVIAGLSATFPTISELAEDVPPDFVALVAIAGGAATLVSAPADATEVDLQSAINARVDDALTPEQTDN